MPRPLTTRQKQIYHTLKSFLENHHRSPSDRELAALCDTYPTLVVYNLLVLQNKGYIAMAPQLTRTSRIIKPLEEEQG